MKTVAMAMSKRPLPDVKTAGVLGQMLVNPIAAASPTCAIPPTIVPTSNTTMLISVVNCTIQLQRTSHVKLSHHHHVLLSCFSSTSSSQFFARSEEDCKEEDEDKSEQEGRQSEVHCEEEEEEEEEQRRWRRRF